MEELQRLRKEIGELDVKIDSLTEELSSLNSRRYDLMEKKWSLVRHLTDEHYVVNSRENDISEFK